MSARPESYDHVPNDTEFNSLYDKVWTGYAPEAAPAIGNPAQRWATPPPPPPLAVPASPAPRYDDELSPRPPAPTKPNARRPLPPTPGSSSTSSAFSPSSPRPSPRTPNPESPRTLPVTPAYSNGYHIATPTDTASMIPSTLTLDRSSSFTTSVHSMSRTDSLRPSGAGAPSVPGQRYASSVSDDSFGSRDRKILDDTPEYTPPSSQFFQQQQQQGFNPRSSWIPSPPTTSPPITPYAVDTYEGVLYDGPPSTSFTPSNITDPPYEYPGPSTTSGQVSTAGSRNSFSNSSDVYTTNAAGPSNPHRRNTSILQELSAGFADQYSASGVPSEIEENAYWDGEEDEDETRFVNFSLLSHIAVQLRDKVPRGSHVKGSIPYPNAFTGKDVVSTIQSQIQRELAVNHGISTSDRRAALQVARSLQNQLFFYEVEWGEGQLHDGVEDVYMFYDELAGVSSDGPYEVAELPTGVVTVLTKCYSPGCDDGALCYAPRCPRKGEKLVGMAPAQEEKTVVIRKDWTSSVPEQVLASLPDTEISRQTIIHKLMNKEEQYLHDLDIVETAFIRPLRLVDPPVIATVDDFVDEVFGNILDLRECNRRLLEVMYVRQREQSPVIQRIGDIFLDAATEFRLAYPTYLGHQPLAEKRLKDELEHNPEFRLFIEQCARNAARPGEPMRTLKHFLERPSEHLQKYPVLLQAVFNETAEGNPDADFLVEAMSAIKNLHNVAQLQTFQSAMGRGTSGKWEWHDLVSPEIRSTMSKEECKRQSIIFELIKGEMAYVKDLENIGDMYIRPLRTAVPPIIDPDRLDQFLEDVFHNFAELHAHHRRLVDKLHEIQREEHPRIRSITAAVFDAALNFRDAYMEYIPNYPIASYRIDDEMVNNEMFKEFVAQAVKHPDAHRLDMKNFINRPIPRLLRYELLLRGILDETPHGWDDKREIPEVLDVIKALGKDTEPGVVSAKQKVELWKYNSNIVFKAGEWIDMDLLDPNRSLIHTGKLLRQPDGGLEWNGWSELYVLLFDNYLVMTKPRDRDGVTKYHVNRRPIPLDLLTLMNFSDPPTQRGTGLLRNLRGGERHTTVDPPISPTGPRSPETSTADSRAVFPCTIHCNGRMGGNVIMYAESAQARTEWKEKLEEAIGLRTVVQESNKVFEVETLSSETFLIPSILGGSAPSWNLENSYTGKVTCSVPFDTADGRALVAIGCAEGVWIGFRHDSRSMRRVLHLKSVSQCTMLEDFGIFLVLADKSLFAYHIEALVPSSPTSSHINQTPQKLNGNKDVSFFVVGQLYGRTLVIWMRKKGLESSFYVLEPVIEKINERAKPTPAISRFGFRSTKSDWFREYREFFIPSEASDLVFLKSKIAILHTKGFEIMDLMDFKSKTIPNRGNREDPASVLLTKRCDTCRPIGMFRTAPTEFLLCYDEFGVYVDKRGDPSRLTGPVEWEGTAQRVALHSPYILLFDTRFIEIRHIQTGRLAQIMPGNNIHCIWDGRGLSPPGNPLSLDDNSSNGDDRLLQEPHVHVVSSANDSILSSRQSRAIAQHVFELIPTIPLYLPGSLASPPHITYFPTSYSPTHSPPNRPATLHTHRSQYSLA